ncbi:hypothetical protein E8E13_001462 [Curvularia kusanoi]|uniref:Uncharacterized protein n=1 Tax=Curvularia kusanoi TaxID=90978 RepID=A0A9P4TLN5_CURKU|nr:hypothetical protein E8E13_001462 [Curvularia kusanoi]
MGLNSSASRASTTLASEGHTVIAAARKAADLEARVKSDSIPNTHVLHADLTSPDSLRAAATTTASLVPSGIDHLIINGAYISEANQVPTEFSDKPELFLSEFLKSAEVNVAGPLFAINAFLPLLRKGAEKRVTYVSSGLADLKESLTVGSTTTVPYSASKAAGNLVIARFAAELKEEGLTFLSIAPGVVATEMMLETSANMTGIEAEKMQGMFRGMAQKYPDWKGPVSTQESVDKVLKVVKGAKVEQSGLFLSYHGNTTEWV